MDSLFTVQMLRGFFLLWVCLHIVQMTGKFLLIAQKEVLSVSCFIMDPSLLHNRYGSIPIGHSVTLKKNYENIKVVLERLKYCVHQWLICVDLKMVNFLLGQQGGHTKYPCFLCYWDSRANKEYWVRKEHHQRIQ